jgi:hypothetical protein
MKTLLIFNGGKEGGLLLTSDGAWPAPPFEADILNSLKATAKLVMALTAASDREVQSKLSRMAIGAANLSVEMIENLLGPLDPERAIVFQDADGGFTCGSTGKPPLPVYWPPRFLHGTDELIKTGIVSADVVELIKESKAKGKDLIELFEQPAAVARELGLPLSAKGAEDLSKLAPSKTAAVENPVGREILNLFYAVLRDGRFTETWFNRPYEVSRLLNVTLSETALERILALGSPQLLNADPAHKMYLTDRGWIAVGIIFAGVCIAIGTLFVGQIDPIDSLVRDNSGEAKF